MLRPTGKQIEVFDFIGSFIGQHGISPTFQEIATEFGVALKSARCHVLALEKKGFLKRTPSQARSLKILK